MNLNAEKDYCSGVLGVRFSKQLSRYLMLLLFASVLLFQGCAKQLSESGCGIIPDEFRKDQCYLAMAYVYSSEYYCEKIMGKDFESSGTNPKRDECYLKLAEKKNDSSLCMKIKGTGIGNSQADCYVNIAIRTADVSMCYAASGDLKERCISMVGNLTKSNGSYVRTIDQYSVAATVTRTSGEVLLNPFGTKEWLKINVGTQLMKGDVIKTGKSGTVRIEYSSGAEPETLGPDSQALIN